MTSRAKVPSREAIERALTRQGVEWSHSLDLTWADFVVSTSVGSFQMTPTEAYYFALGLATKEKMKNDR